MTANWRRAFCIGAALVSSLVLAPRAQEPRIFTFRAGFWLHLHHFLYVLGRVENSAPDRTRRAVAEAPRDQSEGLSRATPGQVALWREAVQAYASGPSRLDAVFDRDLWEVTAALSGVEEAASLDGVAVPAAVRNALERAAPVYRDLWWPAHGRRSRDFADELQTWVRLDGATILSIVTRVYGESWPAGGFPVNVSAYTNWAGAYSTGDRLLVISSRDPGLAGSLALETVFHEAMHQWDDPMQARLTAAAARQRVARVPDGLSHALVFYTAGEAVRRVVAPHVPYAEANGLWTRGPLAPFKPALDTAWLPYLRTGANLDAALDALLTAAQ